MDGGWRLTRREVLIAAAGVVGAGVLGAGPSGALTAHRHRWRWEKQWSAPIYSLDDYRHRCPGHHFPADSIMLTIDDGPSPEWTPKFLRLLGKLDVKATFCMIGEQVPANHKLVRAVVAEGHHIANHSWSHDEGLAYRSQADIHRELAETNDAIVTACGFRPRQFRSPGGDWGSALMGEIAQQEMMPLGWNIDPRDWALPGVSAIESAMLAARRHDIVLCHDGGGDRSETYAALESVLPQLKRRGMHFALLPAPQPASGHTGPYPPG
jgi:peptidoglycan/xylan/chitin deacetylase (PgdA/CDA1 family)